MPNPSQGVGWKLGFSAVVLFAALGLGELGLRLLEEPLDQTEGTSMVADQTKIWALEPGESSSFGASTQVGPLGLRQTSPPGPEGSPVVLTLGDSSVFGHGVADGATLHDQLQAKLSARGVEAQVQCGGVPGYSTVQSLRLMEEVGWGLEPKVLVIANQFSDMNRDQYEDTVVLEQLARPSVRMSRWLARSAVFRGLQGAVAARRGVPDYAAVGWPSPASQGVPRVSPTDYVANLERLLGQARERSVGVVLLQLPERQAMLNGDRPTYAVLMGFVGEAWGVPVLEGDRIYQASGEAVGGLFQDEVHPSARGHALLADALAALLLDSGFPQRVVPPLVVPRASVPVFEGELPPSRLESVQEDVLNQR